MDMSTSILWQLFCSVYVYQIIVLYTLNLHKVMCEWYVSNSGKIHENENHLWEEKKNNILGSPPRQFHIVILGTVFTENQKLLLQKSQGVCRELSNRWRQQYLANKTQAIILIKNKSSAIYAALKQRKYMNEAVNYQHNN